MATLKLTVLARLVLIMVAYCAERGADRAQLLAASGIDPADLENPDARVPLSRISHLWRIAAEMTGDAHLGMHVGTFGHSRDMGLVGYAIYHSPTLGQAVDRLVRYSRVISEVMIFHMSTIDDRVRMRSENAPRLDAQRHPVDARLAFTLTLAREVTGVALMPVEVEFPYPQPTDLAEHERIFGAALRFDRPEAGMTLLRSDLERPVVAADATLAGYLDLLAERELESVSGDAGLVDRVRNAIWSDLSTGEVSLVTVAARLGISGRSLQRYLKQCQTSFAGEMARVRREMAFRLLEDRDLGVGEIAFLLGYSSPGSFQRAFRQWERLSPLQYRRALADGKRKRRSSPASRRSGPTDVC